jgi:hypothetical protein
MHTAFWLAWFTPIFALAYVGNYLPVWVDLVLLPYLVLATIGAWRSTKSPPGALWAASIYRLALVLFVLVALVGILSIVYIFIIR